MSFAKNSGPMMVAFRDLPANIELYPVVVFYSQVSSIHNSSLLIRIMKRLKKSNIRFRILVSGLKSATICFVKSGPPRVKFSHLETLHAGKTLKKEVQVVLTLSFFYLCILLCSILRLTRALLGICI